MPTDRFRVARMVVVCFDCGRSVHLAPGQRVSDVRCDCKDGPAEPHIVESPPPEVDRGSGTE